ncbi:MAG TPA: serine/threonine-protein kinase [Gemmatimonadaceae bacterium]|nr:serine/threonine-protein kinase [Gemmatimonadaceae bacterium]
MRALAERALSAHYELDRELGRGGMGIVYRARDRRLKRTVAIKLLPPELAFRGEIKSRFLREAETAAQLSHPNIVPIYSVDEREGVVFFVMACVDGVTLAKRLHDEGRLSIEEARRILREVADALAYAHARGVVHRDIKPDNILLEVDSGRAMVTDFGIARAVQEGSDSRLTATGVAIGTPAYMSPEQAAGDREIDGRSDLYSLGVVAYQMLTGQLPFQAASTPSMLMKHITETPAPVTQYRPDVPRDLATITMTLLEKDPERRFASASALSLALAGDAGAMPQHAAEPVAAPAPAVGAHGTSPAPSWMPTPPVSPLPAGAGHDALVADHSGPTPEDIARWSAPEVVAFRSSFAKYAFVNAVIVLAALFMDTDFLTITVIWSMFMAFKYSKLWAANYDWRDVFRQPRDRRLVDVVRETIEETRGAFDRSQRGANLPQRPSRSSRPLPRPSAPPSLPAATGFGQYGGTVARAEHDRGEILRIVGSLPKSDQALVNGVIPAADGLFQRVRSLATSLVELDRENEPGTAERIEAQIEALEAQANPLEVAASEERVRRLALLKRQRRAVADAKRRREESAAKLESCAIALQNMRIDVLRLRAGAVADATGHLTVLTERARSLAEDVDAAVQGAMAARRPERGRV